MEDFFLQLVMISLKIIINQLILNFHNYLTVDNFKNF